MSCEVQGAMALTLHITRLLGLAPLRMRRTPRGWRVSYSRAARVYSVIILTITYAAFAASNIVMEYLDPSHAIFLTNDLTVTLAPLRFVIEYSIGFLVTFGARHRMKLIIKCVNILQQIKNKTGDISSKSTNKAYYTKIVICNLFCVFGVLKEDYEITTKYYKLGQLTRAICTTWTFTLQEYVLYMITLQFIVMAVHVQSALIGVNDTLEKCITDLDKGAYNITSVEAQDAVRRVSIAYGAICDVVTSVDGCFSKVLFVVLCKLLYGLVIIPYLILQQLNYAWMTCLLMNHCLYILVFCDTGTILDQELIRTRVLVGQLLRRVSSPRDPLALELDLFYKQIQLLDISFTPMGVCTLNRAFFITVLGAAIPLIYFMLEKYMIN